MTITPDHRQYFIDLGYRNIRFIPSRGICGTMRMLYTTGLIVDLRTYAYAMRYCYAEEDEARIAVNNWTGEGDPPGPWIKAKGAGMPDRSGPRSQEALKII